MAYYITFGDFQRHLTEYYERTGMTLQFPALMNMLNKRGLLKDHLPNPDFNVDLDTISSEEFDKLIEETPLVWPHSLDIPELKIQEDTMMPDDRDVFIFRQLCHTRSQLHTHNYFELNYVEKGEVLFEFEGESIPMHAGELCLVAPNSRHDMNVSNPDARLYSISIRISTFNSVFFGLISNQDMLSHFFRNIMQGADAPNYLRFYVEDTTNISRYVRHLMVEAHEEDRYACNVSINYVYLLLTDVLRHYSQTIQHYDYQNGTDFSLILQYIQSNYQTVTLSFLAELFHYSEAYLCNLIKQSSGFTFTALLRQIRMKHAVDYLLRTDLKINEIAELLGYNSADHFSRVFKSYFNASPQTFKKENKHSYTESDTKLLLYAEGNNDIK